MTDGRARSARLLAWGAPLFALLMWRISPWFGESSLSLQWLLYAVVVPVFPFWIFAGALHARRKNGEWRYSERYVVGVSGAAAALIAAINVWWYVGYGDHRYTTGGANFALGCLIVFLPVMIALLVVLGLALAAEKSERIVVSKQ